MIDLVSSKKEFQNNAEFAAKILKECPSLELACLLIDYYVNYFFLFWWLNFFYKERKFVFQNRIEKTVSSQLVEWLAFFWIVIKLKMV